MKIDKLFALSLLPIALNLFSCNEIESNADYKNEVVFEKALNDGEDVVDKTVQFLVKEVKFTAFEEYNLWAGEHLNFVSKTEPECKKGDHVVVKVTKTYLFLGSHMIEYVDLMVL